MWRFRLLLLPIGSVIELIAMAMIWLISIISPTKAEKAAVWTKNKLPNLYWYMGE